jgi:hypothetical protein
MTSRVQQLSTSIAGETQMHPRCKARQSSCTCTHETGRTRSSGERMLAQPGPLPLGSLPVGGTYADLRACRGDLRDRRWGSVSEASCSRDASGRDTDVRRSASGRHNRVRPTTPDGAKNAGLCAHPWRGHQTTDVPLCLQRHARPFSRSPSAASGRGNLQAALGGIGEMSAATARRDGSALRRSRTE